MQELYSDDKIYKPLFKRDIFDDLKCPCGGIFGTMVKDSIFKKKKVELSIESEKVIDVVLTSSLMRFSTSEVPFSNENIDI